MLLVNGELKPHELDKSEDLRKWNLISFELGLAGLLPIPSHIEAIKIDGNRASVITEFHNKIQRNPKEKLKFSESLKFQNRNTKEMLKEGPGFS